MQQISIEAAAATAAETIGMSRSVRFADRKVIYFTDRKAERMKNR